MDIAVLGSTGKEQLQHPRTQFVRQRNSAPSDAAAKLSARYRNR